MYIIHSLGLLPFFEACWPNNSPRDRYQSLWECNTQSPRLWPYSCVGTQHSPWDCCRSSNHIDQTVPGTITRVYKNATCSPQECNHIHMWIWRQSGGLLFGHFDSKDDSSPRDCVVHHRMNMVTVLGTVVLSLWFKLRQQSHRLGCAPPYE